MGHKVNPISFRLPLNKKWQAKWFSTGNFADNLTGDVQIRQALAKKLTKNSGVALIEIVRDQDSTKVVLSSSKPGILIGRSGQGITDIKAYLLKHCPALRDPKTGQAKKKLEIEIQEIKNPDLYARLVAENVAYQIEKRLPYKRAVKQSISRVMDAKAKGVKINIAGRLGGAEIARREHYGAGSVPLGKLRADIDFAKVDALTTYGIIGVKVWIYKGDIIEADQAE